MKKAILILVLFLGLAFCVFGQASGPIDLIVLLDTSAGMSSYYRETSDYLIGPFLREFLRIGDTFHLISFAGAPRLEISRRIEGIGDMEVIIARLLLMYPLYPQSNLGAALGFAENYITTLPGNRPRKLVLITDGSAANTETLVNNTQGSLRNRGVDFQFIQIPVVGAGPPSGRPAVALAPPTQPIPLPPIVAVLPPAVPGQQVPGQPPPVQEPGQQVPGQQVPGQQVPGQPPPQVVTPPPGQQVPGQQIPGQQIPEQQVPGQQVPGQPPPQVVTPPPGQQVPEQQIPGQQVPGQQVPEQQVPGQQVPGQPPPQVVTPPPGQQVPGQQVPGQQVPGQPPPAQEPGQARNIPLPLLIALGILALIALILLVIFAARRLHDSPNRVMARAASPADTKNAELMSSYAQAQKNQARTPLAQRPPERKPLPKDKEYTDTYTDGPVMLNLFVHDQNTAIGRRNIHTAKSSSSFSVGGGKSDFLIFLVPVPPNIANVRYDGRNCTFTPLKPKYFPDIGSQSVPNCIGKTIRVLSDKDYELHIRVERYEDPLKVLNKLLNSISVPGPTK